MDKLSSVNFEKWLQQITDDIANGKLSIQDIEVIRNAFEAALTGPTSKAKDESPEMSKEPFTDLQMELMRLISSGMSNVAIAAARFTTVKSTENAISRLAKKLGIPTDDKSNQRVLIAKYFFKLSKVQHIND